MTSPDLLGIVHDCFCIVESFTLSDSQQAGVDGLYVDHYYRFHGNSLEIEAGVACDGPHFVKVIDHNNRGRVVLDYDCEGIEHNGEVSVYDPGEWQNRVRELAASIPN